MNLDPYMKLRGDWTHPCWDWANTVYQGELGVSLPDLPVTREEITSGPWVEVPIGQERENDLLLFRKPKPRKHVGICVGSGLMAHYEEDGLGAMLERYKSVIWRDRLIAVYRHDDIR